MKQENILISGVNGFIGRHLSETIRDCANISSSFLLKDKSNNKANNKALGIDILNLDQLKQKVTDVDLIIHLAAKTSVEKSVLLPYDTYYTNVLGTLNLLELSRARRIPKFIYISTYVYGNPISLPVDENHPVLPHSPYNKSKLLGEDLCRNYSLDYGINVAVLRLFSIYGPNCRSGSFVASIIDQINKIGKVLLTSRGIKRDFLFVYDFISLILLIDKNFPKGYNIYNVGSGKSYSLEYVSSLVADVLQKELIIEYKNDEKVPIIYDIVADISKVSDTFNWVPSTRIEDGVELTLNPDYRSGNYISSS